MEKASDWQQPKSESESEPAKVQLLDEEKVRLLGETFGQVNMYLQNGVNGGFLKLQGPGLFRFELPHAAARLGNNVESVEEELLDDLWLAEEPDQVLDLTKPEHREKLGCIERDEATGELCMLVPIEIDMLLDGPECVIDQSGLDEADDSSLRTLVNSKIEINTKLRPMQSTFSGWSEQAPSSLVTLTAGIAEKGQSESEAEQPKVRGQPLYELRSFKVPQMELNFKIRALTAELDGESDC